MSVIPWWIKYPYVNDEIQNLDWLLKQINENTENTEEFINLNKIKYANPILWDITSQYEANTIVVDPQTGDAYISVAAVPYGVSLSNTTYWTKIYNYSDAINNLQEQIAIANEELSTTATAARSIGDLVWLNGELYEVIAAMIPGDAYVENSNCIKTTIEEYVNTRFTAIHQLLAYMGDLANLNTTDKSTLVAAINEVLTTITDITGDLDNLNTTDKSTLVAAINEVLATVNYIIASRTKSYVLVSDMIADSNLTAGEVVSTLGYSTAGVGAATYEISATAGTAAITLSNGLYANIQVSDEIYLAQLGAESNDDISSLLADAISLINGNGIIHFDDDYKINSKVSIELATHDAITIDGHEHYLFCNVANDYGIYVDTAAGSYGYNFNLRNISLSSTDRDIYSGIQFDGVMSSLNRSEFTNCIFSDLNKATSIDNSRMFLFDNCAFWSCNNDFFIKAYDGGNAGDLEIENCQFSKNAISGNAGVNITLNTPTSSDTIAGITIYNNDLYKSTQNILFVGPGTFNDIWIDNNQFDGNSDYNIQYVNTAATVVVNNIQITNNYSTGPSNAIQWYTPNGFARNVDISNNYINGNSADNMTFNINTGAKSTIIISHNKLRNCIRNTNTEVIGVASGLMLSFIGNIIDNDSTTYQILKATATNVICTNNISQSTSGTTYAVSATTSVLDNNIPV